MEIADIKDLPGLKKELETCENMLLKIKSYESKKICSLTNKISILKYIIKREESQTHKNPEAVNAK